MASSASYGISESEDQMLQTLRAEQVDQNDQENGRKTYRASRQPLDEDDMIGHLKALQNALSVPLFQIIEPFGGNPMCYKKWVKEIQRYAQLTKLEDKDITRIAYVSCKGPPADFIKRYIEETEENDRELSWNDLQRLLKKRFDEITDEQQALSILRRMRQFPEESVQLYSERFLRVADEAYPDSKNDQTKAFIQAQMTGTFIDGLNQDYLKMKLLREAPKTFEDAVELAVREQNLRKRFNLRNEGINQNVDWNAQNSFGNYSMQNQGSNLQNQLGTSLLGYQAIDQRQIEPMEIGCMRKQICIRCKGRGHSAKVCPSRIETERRRIYNIEEESESECEELENSSKYDRDRKRVAFKPNRNKDEKTETKNDKNHFHDHSDWDRGQECVICHLLGHVKKNCPTRYVPDRNRVPIYRPKSNWNQNRNDNYQNRQTNYQNRQANFQNRQPNYQFPRKQPSQFSKHQQQEKPRQFQGNQFRQYRDKQEN